MCTVSWIHEPESGNYELLFNRDEKFTRSAALPPAVHQQGGTRFLAPVDPDGGGTWLSVNDRGLTLCLLNGVAEPGFVATQSRGTLVQSLADAVSTTTVRRRLLSADLSPFAAFVMVAVSSREAELFRWDGSNSLLLDRPMLPVTSSSFDTEPVCAARRREFQKLEVPLTIDSLLRFHHSHGSQPDGSAYSTCMHREDAATVSCSRIRVTADEVGFEYLPSSPCRHAAVQTTTLSIPRNTT